MKLLHRQHQLERQRAVMNLRTCGAARFEVESDKDAEFPTAVADRMYNKRSE